MTEGDRAPDAPFHVFCLCFPTSLVYYTYYTVQYAGILQYEEYCGATMSVYKLLCTVFGCCVNICVGSGIDKIEQTEVISALTN